MSTVFRQFVLLTIGELWRLKNNVENMSHRNNNNNNNNNKRPHSNSNSTDGPSKKRYQSGVERGGHGGGRQTYSASQDSLSSPPEMQQQSRNRNRAQVYCPYGEAWSMYFPDGEDTVIIMLILLVLHLNLWNPFRTIHREP
jgi:hypothetical protein